MARQPKRERNGPLRVPLPFEEAIRAALETRARPEAGEPPAKKKRARKPPKRG